MINGVRLINQITTITLIIYLVARYIDNNIIFLFILINFFQLLLCHFKVQFKSVLVLDGTKKQSIMVVNDMNINCILVLIGTNDSMILVVNKVKIICNKISRLPMKLTK